LDLTRRNFLKFTSAAGALGVAGAAQRVRASVPKSEMEDWYGVLVDTTVCIGCRKCEWACKDYNKLPNQPIEKYDDKSVFDHMRRPDSETYTVVNAYDDPNNPEKPYYVKVQCMHCLEPACVSACIVGALTKDEKTGAVVYDAWKCIGCRYCMASCPFQIPTYEYENALTPQVRKELAHDRIAKYPDKYVDHVYGENELGGTAWMYLSGKPMWEMDMMKFKDRPIPSYTEPVQHGLFKHFIPEISLFAFLGGIMWLFKNREEEKGRKEGGDK